MPPAEPPRHKTSQLAIASLVLALVGIPLVGCLLGPVAIICGALALSTLQNREHMKGFGLAVAGMILGILDLAGWVIGLWLVAGEATEQRQSPPPPILSHDIGLDDAPPAIRRALLANARVVCETRSGPAHVGAGVVLAHLQSETLV
ncbi:DUF4190 domain-containing protein, partial [Myxococcota bacterium]